MAYRCCTLLPCLLPACLQASRDLGIASGPYARAICDGVVQAMDQQLARQSSGMPQVKDLIGWAQQQVGGSRVCQARTRLSAYANPEQPTHTRMHTHTRAHATYVRARTLTHVHTLMHVH